MIIRFLEIFTEYVSIILCIHRVEKKEIKINWLSLFDFGCCVMLSFMGEWFRFGKLIVYAYLFVYIRMRVTNSWKRAIKPFAITFCTMPILQLLLYAVISYWLPETFDVCLIGTIVSTLMIIIFLLWKDNYLQLLVTTVTKFRKVVFFLLLIFLVKCLISYFAEYKIIHAYLTEQIIICFLIVALMLILWINSENEKQHKAEELRSYQLYTKTFEDAITAIRMKQHEFDNHINAIKCMQYTIHDVNELINQQNEYCEKILQDNKYNKLLKLNLSPILVGYLYSKFTAVEAQGVNIEYEIQDVSVEHIAINDLIEIIGILFDNAVEALTEQGDNQLEICLLKEDNKFIFSIANISGWKTNSEIEKFFEYGYSTKGKEHGIGLCRANALLKKYKACMQVGNIAKNNMNYLCFKVIF